MIEEVKKLLRQLVALTWVDLNSGEPQGMRGNITEKAQQICQLFEPQISPYALPSQAYDKHFTPPEPKPDSGLLTPEEIGDALDLEIEATYPRSDGSFTMTISVDKLLKAQDAKTASILNKEWAEDMDIHENNIRNLERAKCQHRVGEIFEEIEAFHRLCGRQDMNELISWLSLKKRNRGD